MSHVLCWETPAGSIGAVHPHIFWVDRLLDHCRFFEAFIKERSMYYVCSNMVKPLTEPSQLSFVELIGPTEMKWFVSHYWGMAVRHFNDAIRSPDLQT